MIRYRAAWILPIARPPIRAGHIDVDEGRIVAVGDASRDAMGGTASPEVIDLGELALLPALVNAHTHLELAALEGRVPPAQAMPDWVRTLLRERARLDRERTSTAMASAVVRMRDSGTGLVGDVTNTLASVQPLVESGLRAVVFQELIRFNAGAGADEVVREALDRRPGLPRSERVRLALAAHAPYSVGPALLRVLERAAGTAPMAVHLAESPEEIEFRAAGTGPWRRLLAELGAWDETWEVPRCGPVEYLDRLGWLTPRTLAVHGVQLTDPELAVLAARGTTLVTCPRSNRWTGAGRAPVERFFGAGLRVAIGTDSLASVPDLNLFAELADLRALSPGVPAGRLLHAATLGGAEALGFGAELGALLPGRRAAIIGVRVPHTVTDVEEYLVSGVGAGDVRWIAC